MPFDENAIRHRIEQAARSEMNLTEDVAGDVAFHITDWLSDLETFYRFCQNPAALSNEDLSNLLMAFLVHVPNHVAADGKLYSGMAVTDIFKVGAIDK
ncbi:MAG: hypothetical protein LH481_15660 [Burkholderiales bacterium]|nr:hypothetical protein [Burkholderiales bacterium]